MGISVIVPTLNVEATLAASLRSVRQADEIIVVDAGSSDHSACLARKAGASVLTAPKGRGCQLHAGALAAQHEWLLFLHGDTTLAPRWRDHVDTQCLRSDARDIACVFRFKLDDASWRARVLERLVALRVFLFALPYGDQGLLIHRDFYTALGGFKPLPLMEDVDIIRRIGRRRLTTLPLSLIHI